MWLLTLYGLYLIFKHACKYDACTVLVLGCMRVDGSEVWKSGPI